MTETHASLRDLTAPELRQAIRSGRYARHTAGLGRGVLQANLAILPAENALDFMRFCQRNPKPCPLTAVSETGDPILRTAGADIDIRTDVPAYNIYRDGRLAESRTDIGDLWRDDLVTFALGCSFTFERALADEGIAMRHIDEDLTVPMFRSSIRTVPAGPFGGAMVVSMRPIPEDRVDDVIRICRTYPLAHGAPVHAGDPAKIGIRDVVAPDWGDAVAVRPGEVPVFWACGVTPQVALERAGLPLCITHKPGHMLVTDIPETAESPILDPEGRQDGPQQGELK